MIRLFPLVCASALFLAGCGGPEPKLDTATDTTTEASLKTMTDGMSDAEKKRFQSDLDIVANVSQFSSTPAKGNGPSAKYAQLDGLTAREIRERTAKLRMNLSR